jgi:hypothetical protein
MMAPKMAPAAMAPIISTVIIFVIILIHLPHGVDTEPVS